MVKILHSSRREKLNRMVQWSRKKLTQSQRLAVNLRPGSTPVSLRETMEQLGLPQDILVLNQTKVRSQSLLMILSQPSWRPKQKVRMAYRMKDRSLLMTLLQSNLILSLNRKATMTHQPLLLKALEDYRMKD